MKGECWCAVRSISNRRYEHSTESSHRGSTTSNLRDGRWRPIFGEPEGPSRIRLQSARYRLCYPAEQAKEQPLSQSAVELTVFSRCEAAARLLTSTSRFRVGGIWRPSCEWSRHANRSSGCRFWCADAFWSGTRKTGRKSRNRWRTRRTPAVRFGRQLRPDPSLKNYKHNKQAPPGKIKRALDQFCVCFWGRAPRF